jgi:hypothetical protein
METTVQWTHYAIGGLPAKAVSNRLEQLTKKGRGRLTPENVVADAKPKNALLHPCFEWNNNKAAEQYRLEQARLLMRSIEIVYAPNGDNATGKVKVRKCVHIQDDKDSFYTTIERAMDNPAYQKQLEQTALAELNALRHRYGALKKFAKIWKAIDLIAVS